MKNLNDKFDKFCIDYKILNLIEADYLREGDRKMAHKHHKKGEKLIGKFHKELLFLEPISKETKKLKKEIEL